MIELIKKSKDSNEANKRILERKWNAKNLANLLKEYRQWVVRNYYKI